MPGQWLTAVAGIAGVKNAAAALARRIVRRAMLTGLIGVLWLVAAGFALACFAIWLASLVGIIAACAIVAAILAAAALAIQLGMSVDAAPPNDEPAELHAAATRAPRAETVDREASVSDETALAGAAFVSLAGYLLGRMVRRP